MFRLALYRMNFLCDHPKLKWGSASMKTIHGILNWIFRLFYVNLLWLTGCAIGLVIFGFVPSTIAMYKVIRSWKIGQRDINIYHVFITEYRASFKSTYLLGIPIFLIGFTLIFELQIFWQQESTLYYMLSFIVMMTIVVFISILIHFFPIYVHYDFRLIRYIKMSFIMGIIHPIRTIGMLILLTIFYFLFLLTPLIFTVIGFSVAALVINHLVYEKFPYTDQSPSN